MHYRLSDVEASWLLDLVVAKLAEVAARMVPQEHPSAETHKPTLLLWCRIAAELHEPSASMPPAAETAPARAADTFGLEHFMPELARREGLDFAKEYGPMDPRAFAPKCTHGKLFSQPCPECEGRCAHGLEQASPCAQCGRGVESPSVFDGPRVDGGEELVFDELTRELIVAGAAPI